MKTTVVVVDGSSKVSEVMALAEILEQQAWDIRRAIQNVVDGEEWLLPVTPAKAIAFVRAAIETLEKIEPRYGD
jgi:hypothetical protein